MHITERKHYLLHAKRYLARKIESAHERIQAGFQAMQNPIISLSFGKDSLVMAHLIRSEFRAVPVVFVDCGLGDEWPDTARVKSQFLKKCPSEVITLRGPSILSAFRESVSNQ